MKQITFFLSVITLLIGTNPVLAKKDTTLHYCHANLDKCKKKWAGYYAKVFRNPDGTYGVLQYTKSDHLFMSGSYTTKRLNVKEGTFVHYEQNGNLKSTGNYRNNLKTGEWKYFSDKGAQQGEWVEYAEESQMKTVSNYKNGKLHGDFRRQYRTLTITKGSYVEGKKDGEWKAWFKNGQLNYEGIYVSGKRNGEWKFYFESRKIAATEQYDKGKPVKIEWFNEDGSTAEPSETLEEEPSFPGGESALAAFINNHINYPIEAKENGEQGVVYVQFNIQPDGSITDIRILRGISNSIDAEVLRLIKAMPKWNPNIDHNRTKTVLFTMPIHFRLG